jgi:quercetin 2,3-dioxygenase
MQTHFFSAAQRGHKDIGWLKSRFHFSFSDYCNPTASAFGTLVAFNDDLLAVGNGFGNHPHANMEIVSILLRGQMNHKDSMGYSTVVGEGGVQVMSAGSGLFHEEHNIGEEQVHFLQIWIQPKLQNVMPRYQTRHFPKAGRKNRLQTVVSSDEGIGHCWINQNARISLGYFEAGITLAYPFDPVNKCVFVHCINGSLQIGEQALQQGDALGIWDTDQVDITCTTEAELVVIETPVNQK